MRRSWFELYTLVICLGSLIGLVATLCGLLYAVLAWSDPELTVGSYSYAEHQTNERFLERNHRRSGQAKDDAPKPSDEEVTRNRVASYESLLEGNRRFGKLFTIMNGFGVLLSGTLFAIHWRLARKASAPMSGTGSVQSG